MTLTENELTEIRDEVDAKMEAEYCIYCDAKLVPTGLIMDCPNHCFD